MPNKILYVHVGKTAGTALNKYIGSHFDAEECRVHIENDPHWATTNVSKYICRRFLSGHISLPRFMGSYPFHDYYKMATFRRPIDHIISHLSWVRHLSDKGQESFLAGHPAWVQDISRKLSTLDFSESNQLSIFARTLTNMEAALFDNSQTRYLLNIPGSKLVDKSKMMEALRNLDFLDRVGTTEKYSETLILLARDMGWSIPSISERLNEPKLNMG
jgi:hypothetical protein